MEEAQWKVTYSCYILFSILCFDGTLYLIGFLGAYMALKTEVASQKPVFVWCIFSFVYVLQEFVEG